jgi:glutamate N-acetyltransferase / amino-acid N-acetyltransferase
MNLVPAVQARNTSNAMESSIDAGANPASDTAARPVAVSGVRLASGAAGIRYSDRDDVCLIEIADSANVHCLLTRNKFCAAPVVVARRHLRAGGTRYLIVNAGNANAGTGTEGERRATAMCAAVSRAAGCTPEEVLPFSTGVIGEQLDIGPIEDLVPELLTSLSAGGWKDAATAITTTDTVPKLRSVRVSCGETAYTVVGIAKGSGMIRPNLATMLAFVATDAAVAPEVLRTLAIDSANQSFNRITIDGDTSTNDAFTLIATGRTNGELIHGREHAHYPVLAGAVASVCQNLAQDIVRDGEGATKFISIHVRGGRHEDDCLEVAYTVAESPLVKTALFASDPNWGRILAAIGRAAIDDLRIEEVSIAISGYGIVAGGECIRDYDESRAAALMQRNEIDISIEIGRGPAAATVWTCDFSYDYVKINAEYRS